MLVAIDVSTLRGPAGERGMGRYIIDFVKSLKMRGDIQIKLLLNTEQIKNYKARSISFIYKILEPEFSPDEFAYYAVRADATSLEMACAYNAMLNTLNPDIFLISSPDDQWVARPDISKLSHWCKKGAILFDLIPYIYPDKYLQEDNQLKIEKTVSIYNELDFLLSISKSAKDDFIKIFKGCNTEVYNIDGAASSNFDSILEKLNNNIEDKSNISSEKIIKFCYIAGPDYRKNVYGLLQSLVQLRQKNSNFLCSIVYDIHHNDLSIYTQYLKINGLGDNVKFLGYICDEELVDLYRESDFGIFPSYYEGLGLPILEQIKAGRPVIGSDSSAVKDIIFDQRAMFDPHDINDIANKILEFMEDKELRSSVYESQISFIEKYNWSNVASAAYKSFKKQFALAKNTTKNSINIVNNFRFDIKISNISRKQTIKDFLKNNHINNYFTSDSTLLDSYQKGSNIIRITEFDECSFDEVVVSKLILLVTANSSLDALLARINDYPFYTALLFENHTLLAEWQALKNSYGWYHRSTFILDESGLMSAIDYLLLNYKVYDEFLKINDVTDPQIISQCIDVANRSNYLKQNKRLFLDWSRISVLDEKTGIQRVTKGYTQGLFQLINNSNVDIDIYLSRYNQILQRWEYKYNIIDDWRELTTVFAGDVFYLLDPIWGDAIRDMDVSLNHFANRGVRIYSTLNDILPVYHANWFPAGVQEIFGEFLIRISHFCTGIISISHATQLHFEKWLKEFNEAHYSIFHGEFGNHLDLSYVLIGVENRTPKPLNIEYDIKSDLIPEDYFLVVSTLEPRKGHIYVIEAFEKLWAQGFEPKLVFVGKQGWNVEALIEKIHSSAFYQTKLFWFNDVNDDLLNQFYHNSRGIIAASLNEGFGLSVIEAMSFNKPVICSDTEIFKEVTGGLVEFFETGNSDSLAEVVQQLTAEPQEVNYNDLSYNTWEDSSKQVFKILFPSINL